MKALFLIFVSSFAFAQIPQQDTPTDMPPVHTRPRGKKKSIFNKKAPAKAADHIVGQCIVLAGGGNLMNAPCPEVILTLEGKGEPIHARTDRIGQFEFVTEQGEQYKLVSGSKFYEMVQPTEAVHSGDSVEVHLKQK